MLAASALAIVAAGTFWGTRELSQEDGVSAEPREPTAVAANVTPEPNSTPDRSQPNWYVPYLNADRDAGVFIGVIAGVEILEFPRNPPLPDDPGRCSPSADARIVVAEQAAAALEGHRLGLDYSRLSASVVPVQSPEVLLCDGVAQRWTQNFEVRDSDGEAVGAFSIARSTIGRRAWIQAPETQWYETVVLGEPAGAVNPEASLAGPVAVVYLNTDGGLTLIRGSNVSSQFLLEIAEVVGR